MIIRQGWYLQNIGIYASSGFQWTCLVSVVTDCLVLPSDLLVGVLRFVGVFTKVYQSPDALAYLCLSGMY